MLDQIDFIIMTCIDWLDMDIPLQFSIWVVVLCVGHRPHFNLQKLYMALNDGHTNFEKAEREMLRRNINWHKI